MPTYFHGSYRFQDIMGSINIQNWQFLFLGQFCFKIFPACILTRFDPTLVVSEIKGLSEWVSVA
jgi:hypothetical protein